MIILPAIDLKDGKCVRLFQGDYATAEQVAEDPVKTAQSFEEQGARWVHLVDLDGAKARRPVNDSTVFSIRDNVSMNIEVGGGIRDMDTVEYYLSHGINRIILGSAALHSPEFVREAVKKYGKKIAVGIDALKGKVAAEGWTAQSEVDYLEMAKRMEDIGVRYLIVTDIYKDGTMNGPNLVMLDKVNRAVSCNIIASGGVSNLKDIVDLNALGVYGAIAGKSIYTKALDLTAAITASQRLSGKSFKCSEEEEDHLERYFKKSELIPCIVQEASTNEVLMLAYMNRESMAKTLETGYTWFYSRSRQTLWNKGATSGHTQKVISMYADCDDDTLLVKVVQTARRATPAATAASIKRLQETDGGNTMDILQQLYDTVLERKGEKQEGSYTCYLFEQGLDKILKKCGEECSEVIIAAKNGKKEDTVGEISDLLYHLTVMMVNENIPLDDVRAELNRRHGKTGNLKTFHKVDHNT